MNVLVTTSTFGKANSAPLDRLKEKCEVLLNPFGRKLSTKEFIELSESVDGVIAGVEVISREALSIRRNIKVISRCGVGMDNLDIDACREFGIKVFNTPNAPVDSVAELTIAVILDLLKNVSNMNASLKAGNWNKMTGFMLKEKNVGIIGLGRIGNRVAGLLRAFGVNLAYTDIEDKENEYTYLSVEELLKWADIVTIHTSTCDEGVYVIGQREMKTMKAGAFLINTSRGRFVDEDALFNELKNGHLGGAALDVYSEEPYKGKLTELENVILTPHIASSAKEGRVIMEMEAVRNLFDGLGI